jgi:hypothetical protein
MRETKQTPFEVLRISQRTNLPGLLQLDYTLHSLLYVFHEERTIAYPKAIVMFAPIYVQVTPALVRRPHLQLCMAQECGLNSAHAA